MIRLDLLDPFALDRAPRFALIERTTIRRSSSAISGFTRISWIVFTFESDSFDTCAIGVGAPVFIFFERHIFRGGRSTTRRSGRGTKEVRSFEIEVFVLPLDAGSSGGYFECTCVHKSRSEIAIGAPGAGEGERDGQARSRGRGETGGSNRG